MFNSFISDSFNLHVPVKSVKVTKPLASWLHDSIGNLMKKRDANLHKFKQSENAQNWTEYRRLRNMTLSCIRKAKKNLCESSQSHNSVKKWSDLKSSNVVSARKHSAVLSNPEKIDKYSSNFVFRTTTTVFQKSTIT